MVHKRALTVEDGAIFCTYMHFSASPIERPRRPALHVRLRRPRRGARRLPDRRRLRLRPPPSINPAAWPAPITPRSPPAMAMASRGCASMGRTPPSPRRAACRSASRCRSSSAGPGSRSASPSTSPISSSPASSPSLPPSPTSCCWAARPIASWSRPVLSLRPWRWLSIGAGATLLADAGRQWRRLSTVGRRRGRRRSAAPASDVSLPIRPGPPSRASSSTNPAPAPGLTWRGALDLRVRLDILARVDIAGAVTGTALISLRAANYYTPQRIALGAAFDITPALTLHPRWRGSTGPPSREASPLCASPSRWRDALDGAGRLPRRRLSRTSSCRAPASSIAVRCSATGSASRVAWPGLRALARAPTRRRA